MSKLMELYNKRKLNNDIFVDTSLVNTVSINDRIEELKQLSSKNNLKNNYLEGVKITIQIASNERLIEVIEVIDNIADEDLRDYKKKSQKKQDIQERIDNLRKIKGNGFNSQKLEILLEIFYEIYEDVYAFGMLDLTAIIAENLKLSTNLKHFINVILNTEDGLTVHLISIEENRVLLN